MRSTNSMSFLSKSGCDQSASRPPVLRSAISQGAQLFRRKGLFSRMARDESGGTLIEFALSVLSLVTVTLAIFEFCMLIYTYDTLGDAARQGVRYAVVHGTDNATCSGPSSGCGDTTGANIITVVKNDAAASFHNLGVITVTPSWPDSSSQPGSRVKVHITYNYIPYVILPGGVSPTMSLTAEGRIVF